MHGKGWVGSLKDIHAWLGVVPLVISLALMAVGGKASAGGACVAGCGAPRQGLAMHGKGWVGSLKGVHAWLGVAPLANVLPCMAKDGWAV